MAFIWAEKALRPYDKVLLFLSPRARRCRAPWRLQSRSDRPIWTSRRRPWSNREAGDAEAGAAASGNSTRATVSHPKASAPLAAQPRTEHPPQPAGAWWAEAPHSRGSGLNASSISSSQNRMWLQHRPQRTDRNPASPRISTRVNHLASIGHTPHSSKFRAPKHILSPVLGSVYPIEWCAILR